MVGLTPLVRSTNAHRRLRWFFDPAFFPQRMFEKRAQLD
jgi:hypothetical protein